MLEGDLKLDNLNFMRDGPLVCHKHYFVLLYFYAFLYCYFACLLLAISLMLFSIFLCMHGCNVASYSLRCWPNIEPTLGRCIVLLV